MAGDGGVALVVEPQLLQGAPAPRARQVVRSAAGEEPVEQGGQHLLPRQLGGEGAGEEPAAAAGEGDRDAVGAAGEELLLGRAARLQEQRPLHGVEPGGEARLHAAGQGGVDVVAAEEEVVAHRQPRQGRSSRARRDADEGEVGGAAAHVADQHQPGAAERRREVGPMTPGEVVEGRLGLLQQREPGQPRLVGGPQRQLPGRLVEGGGHRQDDLLLLQRVIREAGVPGSPQVAEVEGRGGHRREARNALGGTPGEDGGGAVHPRVREPALGGGDEPARHPRPLRPRQLAHQRPRRALRRPAFAPRPLVLSGGRRALRRPVLPGEAALRRRELVLAPGGRRRRAGAGAPPPRPAPPAAAPAAPPARPPGRPRPRGRRRRAPS